MALNKSGEKVERLPPKPSVLRKLYLMSGNRCCYPDCDHRMVDADGDFVGEVCHIEAAEAGGQRFNSDRTNEENRDISNLMLMCPNHHTKTNNVSLFTVAKLSVMKSKHESKFLNIERKIANSISDSTDDNTIVAAKNLKRLNRVLGHELDASELSEMVDTLGKYVARLESVPEPTRNFLGAVALRMYKIRETGAVYQEHGTFRISASDVQQALSLGSRRIKDRCGLLENYGLGSLYETGDHEMPWAVSIRSVDGWPLWFDLAEFAKSEGIDFSTFWKDLDFSSLDE
ncbi:hypothetical protein EDF77_2687 [Stenotrophomonas maltophilia]|uniref:HNH endonuclease n=1 Tax=Stenotrophomonas chelatiphaga TaxID=517011 RepID=UPI000F9A6B06|nr:HNH endonuclease [Stenotrophomonas chelatiphaga]MCS4230422.1 hypothetical protein [Stenotrophomonas chelatiphaga]ROQ40350.1 hypothetical protein EDF77_2687 [Stenotrophomonas maltophilia]